MMLSPSQTTPALTQTDDLVNDSPLLQLPPEERKKLVENGEAISFFVAVLYDYQAQHSSCTDPHYADKYDQSKKEEATYYSCVERAFTRYDASKGTSGGFRAYVGTIFAKELRKQRAEEAQERAGTHKMLSKKDRKKLKEITQVIQDFGVDEARVFADKAFCASVAAAVNLSESALVRLLNAKRQMLYLDAETSGALQAQIATQQPEEQSAERWDAFISGMITMLTTFTLHQKETYTKRYGEYASNTLIEYLRGNEKYQGNNRKHPTQAQATPAPDAAQEAVNRDDKLARCDALEPLAQANCLWGVLLLAEYVQFLIAAPLPPRALPPVALNPLRQPAVPPSNKAVAQYLGISGSAASQKMKQWQTETAQALHTLWAQAE